MTLGAHCACYLHVDQCSTEIESLTTEKEGQGETPESTSNCKSRDIHTHSNGTAATEIASDDTHNAPLSNSDRLELLCSVRSSAAGSTLPSDPAQASSGPLPDAGVCKATFHSGGTQDTAVYHLDDLQPGHSIKGPALLINTISTLVVEPCCTAHITAAGDVRVDIEAAPQDLEAPDMSSSCDPIQLAIFSHR